NLPMSYAYSDSITDLPMLELVGHPVVVNGDKELERVAHERDWEIRNFERPVRLRDRMPVPPAGPTLAVGSALAAAGAGVGVWWWPPPRTQPAGRGGTGGRARRPPPAAPPAARADGPVHRLARRPPRPRQARRPDGSRAGREQGAQARVPVR